MIKDILIWIVYCMSLYIVIFWLLYFLDNKDSFENQKKKKTLLKNPPLITVAVPAYNEGSHIAKTIQSILKLNYPKDKIELIIVDDGSTDDTGFQIKKIMKKFSKRNITLVSKENQGKGRALNDALKKSKGEFFVCLDADSVVEKDTLKKMIELYLESSGDLVIVTPVLKVKGPLNWLQKLQNFEYVTAMFIVRLMGHLDCNYIAPGPFTMYKADVIKRHGGFDEDNLVEDQEIAIRMQQKHYKIKQCPDAVVYTVAPKDIWTFYKQRNRWFKGTLLNIFKYKRMMLNTEYGDFGMIQMPINLTAYFLGFMAVFFFLYYLIWPFLKWIKELYLVGFDIMPYLKNLSFAINLLSMDLGKMFVIYITLFLAILTFVLAHTVNKEKIHKKNIIYIIPFFFIYFMFLSFISVIVMVESTLGKMQKW